MKGDDRTPEQIRAHYELEKRLANKLRNASKEERRTLFPQVYDELLSSLPEHPSLDRRPASEDSSQEESREINNFQSLLNKDAIFLEVGPGDCAESFYAAKLVKQVYAVDVSAEVTKGLQHPENFELVISDGTNIPVEENSVDVAFSNQLMEHLHPDDALEQLDNVYHALKPGGVYICITPNRLNGPHDVSMYFDREATGFHLKEYTVGDLTRLFRAAGFSKVRVLVPVKNKAFVVSALPVRMLEGFLSCLPYAIRKPLASSRLVSKLIDIRLVATK